METPQECISRLTNNYIDGKVSKSMFEKYMECTLNVIENKMVKLTGYDAINFAISIGITLNDSFTRVIHHKRKNKTPIIKGEIINFRCGHCGRVFKQKIPHKCNTGYRKRNHNFIPMY